MLNFVNTLILHNRDIYRMKLIMKLYEFKESLRTNSHLILVNSSK